MTALVFLLCALNLFHLASMQNDCSFVLTESIPDGLTYPSGSFIGSPTYKEWSNLINRSQSQLSVAVFYFTLAGYDLGPNFTDLAVLGESILSQFQEKAKLIRFVQNAPTKSLSSGNDTDVLESAGATVLTLNMTSAANLSGVLHTKLWVADTRDAYIGSANMDWRSLTQVKELGVSIYDCPALSIDIYRIYAIYEYLALGHQLPSNWPAGFSALYNSSNPFTVALFDRDDLDRSTPSLVEMFLTSSPPPFVANYRASDIDTLVQTILSANSFVYIAVMDFFPLIEYEYPVRFWPIIDNALRRVTLEKHNVSVCLLISKWPHTRGDYRSYLNSLSAFSGANRRANIMVKQFVVPADERQSQIPFARVNHNKYMVTDNVAFIHTSNWVGDYFTNTAGTALVARNVPGSRNVLREQLESVFLRDWNSNYAQPLPSAETESHVPKADDSSKRQRPMRFKYDSTDSKVRRPGML